MKDSPFVHFLFHFQVSATRANDVSCQHLAVDYKNANPDEHLLHERPPASAFMTPSHPAPPPPSADITGPHNTPSVHLLWHVCHLCNVLLCQFGAYLSLESLNRDTNATGMMPIIEYQPVMASQALMMVDVAKNIEAATDALVRTPAHQDLVNDPCYRSMLDASHALGPIIGTSLCFLPGLSLC